MTGIDCLPSDRLEAYHALGLEDLHGVGLKLIVAGKSFVQADDALGLPLRHGADQFQREFSFQADEEHATRGAVYRLAGQRQPFDWCGKREKKPLLSRIS